jgi:hypothetical protein
MTPVFAKVVFLTSSAVGVATLSGTAYLVKHPEAFAPTPTTIVAPEVAPLVRPDPPAPTVIPEPIVLEPITITGTKAPLIRAKAAPAPRTEPAKPTQLNPCTGWREMGPANIDKGDGTQRKVRTLC